MRKAEAAPKGAARKGGRRSGERPRRSLLAGLSAARFYWGFVALPLGRHRRRPALVAYYAAELPGASEWRVPERPPNIQILAVDGTLIGNRGDTGGESVRIEQLPEYVPNAVIAIEDRRFRSHFGVDPIGLVRAVARNAFAGDVVQGGSTLTQQLAKNMFLTPERSLKRKVQEVVLAVWLESEILQGRDPGDVPEPRLFRRRRLRHRGGGAPLFRPRGERADAAAGGDARRPAAGAEPLCPEPQSGSGKAARQRWCSPRWRPRASSPRKRRRRRATTRPRRPRCT